MKNWFLGKRYFSKWRLILLFLLIFVSCQKDYYLDDLNDALSQITSLQNEKLYLQQQLQEINSQKQQLEQQVSNLNNQNNSLQSQLIALNNSYSNLDSAYNQLIESQQISLNEIEDLKAQIVELANQLRIQNATNSPITDGYYYTTGYGRTSNDSIIWSREIEKNIEMGVTAGIVKVINGEVVEDIQVKRAEIYWNNVGDNDILKHRYYFKNFDTYKDKLGDNSRINEFTGDSIPYITNYEVYDRDIFTWESVYPATSSYPYRIVDKRVSYKIFTQPYEIIDDVIYSPVVNAKERYYGGINNFEEIKEMYDYSSYDDFFSDSIYSSIEQDNPKSYLEAFIKDAERFGVDLSHVNPDELIINPWIFAGTQLQRSAIATASITCSETDNIIAYDNSWFENEFLTDKSFFKLKVMYHEFGHTVLGLKHTCARNHIMYSTSTLNPCHGEEINEFDYFDNITEFKRAVKNMFEGYNQHYYDCYSRSINNKEIIIE